MVGGSGMYADAVMYALDEFPEVDPPFSHNSLRFISRKGLKSFKTYLGARYTALPYSGQ